MLVSGLIPQNKAYDLISTSPDALCVVREINYMELTVK